MGVGGDGRADRYVGTIIGESTSREFRLAIAEEAVREQDIVAVDVAVAGRGAAPAGRIRVWAKVQRIERMNPLFPAEAGHELAATQTDPFDTVLSLSREMVTAVCQVLGAEAADGAEHVDLEAGARAGMRLAHDVARHVDEARRVVPVDRAGREGARLRGDGARRDVTLDGEALSLRDEVEDRPRLVRRRGEREDVALGDRREHRVGTDRPEGRVERDVERPVRTGDGERLAAVGDVHLQLRQLDRVRGGAVLRAAAAAGGADREEDEGGDGASHGIKPAPGAHR